MAGPEKGPENGPRFCKACGPRSEEKVKGSTSLQTFRASCLQCSWGCRGHGRAQRSLSEGLRRPRSGSLKAVNTKQRPIMGRKIGEGGNKLAKASRSEEGPTSRFVEVKSSFINVHHSRTFWGVKMPSGRGGPFFTTRF